MNDFIKKALRAIWLTIVVMAVVLIGGVLAIQLPQVQTFAVQQVMHRLTESIDGEIEFEKIHLKPFTTLVVKNIAIIDKNPPVNPHAPQEAPTDTLFSAEYIIARFTLDGLIRQNGIHLGKTYVNNARFNLVIENKADSGDGDTSTDNLSRMFKLKRKADSQFSEEELFHIRKVIVKNMRFSMKNHLHDRNEYEKGIDWNDLDIRNINVNAKELQFKDGIMTGTADEASFTEKSGYRVNSMSGSAKVGRGKTIITDLYIRDQWSEVFLPKYRMSYRSAKDFSDFTSKVKIDARVAESRLNFHSLHYFAQLHESNDLVAEISGGISGYVNDFALKDMKFTSVANGFSGNIDGTIHGLPDMKKTKLDLKAHDFRVTSKGLGEFISAWMPEDSLDLSSYGKDIIFMVNADASGLLDSLSVNTDIVTMMSGIVDADIRLDNMITRTRPLGISGNIVTTDLDISRFTQSDIVKQLSMDVNFKAQLGNDITRSSLNIKSMEISRLNFMDYDYTSLRAISNISENEIQGGIISQDPNLDFWLRFGYAFSNKTNTAKYQIEANVGEADLHALNLDKRGKSRISLDTSVKLTKTAKGDISGEFNIGDLNLENSDGRYDIGDIILISSAKNTGYEMSLNSSFADGYFKGTASVFDFVKDLKGLTLQKELPAMFKDSSYVWSGNSYGIHFQCYNTKELLSFAIPGLWIEDGTSINGSIDDEGIFSADISSGRLAFKKQYLKGLKGRFSNEDEMLSGSLECEDMKLATLMLKNNRFNATADDGFMTLDCEFDNHSEKTTRGKFIAEGEVSRDDSGMDVDIKLKPSSVFLSGKQWEIESSRVNIKGKEASVESFGLVSGTEAIRVHGGLSPMRKDTLTLSLQQFDISIVNSALGDDIGIRGAADGDIQLTSPMKSKGILIDMAVDSTYLAGEPLGKLYMASTWNEISETFNISAKNELSGKNNINLVAVLSPKFRTLDAKAVLDQFNVSHAQPFVNDVFSSLSGHISGEVEARGPLEDLAIISSGTRLEDAEVTVAYTHVPYRAEGGFHISDKGIFFDDITIRDRYNGSGKLTGSINYDHFRNLRFDTGIIADQIEAIDLRERSGEEFYGNIFGTGKISIKGPANSILMEIDATTAKNGSIHIPMTNSMYAGKSTNLLKFKEIEIIEEIDPYEVFVRQTAKKEEEESNFAMKLRVKAQPDVEAFIEIDKTSGNVLSGRGNGIIDIETGNDNFSINGDYTLTTGNYRFAAMGILGRDFQIQDGSSIKFNGDIMDSALDIDAIYTTKVSLDALIADTTSVSNRRNVECKIDITGNLSNPRIGFGIEIPDLDPTISSRVQSALSTEDKVQKQFLSLILSNSFLPDEQSGIVNNSSLLYSNVTEVMANQLNNIFQKLGIPLDMGLNYQPNEKGNDLFDVALSTQLWNNRLTINTNFGNREYSGTSGAQNEVVGDIDVEYKINRSGTIRANAFSHSADQYTNYLDNSQRTGLGIMVQSEFSEFKEFLNSLKAINIFTSKEARQEARKRNEQLETDEEMTTINITASDYSLADDTDGKCLVKKLFKNKDDRQKRETVSDTISSGRE